MKDKTIRAIFWVMVAFFLIAVVTFAFGIRLAGSFLLFNVLLPFIAVFLVLGIVLLVLTLKQKVAGNVKKFLLLTGASAVGLPVFMVLHNVVSGLFNIEDAVFFILATLLCPLGFLVGAVGTIVLTVKNKSGQLAI